MLSLRRLAAAGLLALSSLSIASALYVPTHTNEDAPSSLATRDNETSSEYLVFCHFMVGIVGDRTGAADYDNDMKRAKDAGIDAFALNIGVDSYSETQLNYAYQSAADNGMKVFISFDFNWFSTGDASTVGQMIAKYGAMDGQLMVDGKIFASSFAGDGFDVAAMRTAAGVDVFFAPNFHPEQGTDFSVLDGALNWMGWPSNGDNKAPDGAGNVSVSSGDDTYLSALGSNNYIAPISPWFFTHFGPEVSYSKNWVFPGDLLWYNRWNEILALKPRFVEIITWNDYGESHYIGPLSSPHGDDGNSKWVNDVPHNGWLDMAVPFIKAYHDGADSPDSYVTDDQLVYWYRPTLAMIDCDSTDTTMVEASNTSGNYFMGRPDGYQSLADEVFVISLLKDAGTITVVSGDGEPVSWDAPAGVSAHSVPMAVGQQQFFVARNDATILSAVSLRDISDVCPCGIYHFNPYVGTVPEGQVDQLQSLALMSLTAGLHVSTCSPTPSLGTDPITPTSTPSSGGSGGGGGEYPVPATTTSVDTTPETSTPKSSHQHSSTPPVVTAAPTKSQSYPPAETSAPSSGGDASNCTAGTGTGNHLGLCQFACQYGYCPENVCTCTATGTPATAPKSQGVKGVPLSGEDDSYLGLCSFACDHGYCPETACTTD